MMWNHVKALILLPFMVMVVIPATILYATGVGGIALQRPAPWNILMVTGAIPCIAIGLTLFVTTVRLFAQIGKGTLAPWNPPQHLVVAGPYRHVRNPMISGVLFILLAEAVFFSSLPLFGWFGFFLLVNSIVIPFGEEPDLEKRFGEEYARYKRNVSRWIPRLTPWQDTDQRSV